MTFYTEEQKKLAPIDPDQRVWEYDGDGTRIYKVSEGYPFKTLYTDEHYEKQHFWKNRGF